MNQTVFIGGRLREDRQRLGLNQTAFGEIGGVTKKTQMLYESAERIPDAAYLVAIAAAGADVQYILTGIPLTDAHAREAWRLAAQITEASAMEATDRDQSRAALLKGAREQAMSTYTQEEIDLIAHYRTCKAEDQAMIRRMAQACSK